MKASAHGKDNRAICPECQSEVLETRRKKIKTLVRGVDFLEEARVVICPACGYERPLKSKRPRLLEV